jgi:uncharacterized OB-fold protein/acyl dehydratase
MTPEEKKIFEAKLYSWAGKEIIPPTPGPDLVNEAMMRQWAEVLGDKNPVYTDKAFAEQSSKKGLIAPPTMLWSWSLEGYPMAFADQQDPSQQDGQRTLHRYMEDHGFTGVLGTNCDQEYLQELRPGDTVIANMVVKSISEEKATAMGNGYFIETLTTFTNQRREVVGTMVFRVLKFKPAQAPKAATETTATDSSLLGNKAPTRLKSVRGHDNAWWWNVVEKDKKLPIQRCKECKTLRHPPRPFCNVCQSGEWDHVESKLQGEIFSFIELHYPEIPGYSYPLICAVITLDEGTRIVSNVIDCKPEEVKIGLRVTGEIMQVDADNIIPQFRLVKG